MLDCPFCGCPAQRIIHKDKPDWWQFECSADGHIDTCPVTPMTHIYDTQHEAEAAWNTRSKTVDFINDMPMAASIAAVILYIILFFGIVTTPHISLLIFIALFILSMIGSKLLK